MQGIDGLRALAALSVVTHHVYSAPLSGVDRFGVLSNLLNTASQGLTLFFALSGFLLYRPFAEAVIGNRRLPSGRQYARNRILRIVPAYLAIFILASYVLRSTFETALVSRRTIDGLPPIGPVKGLALVLSNLTLTQTYLPRGIRSGIGPAWTLTVEIAFYASFPVVTLLLSRLIGERCRPMVKAMSPPIFMIGLGFTGKIVAQLTLRGATEQESYYQQWGAAGHAVLERSLLTQADLFGYGMMVAVLMCAFDSRPGAQRYRRSARWSAVCGLMLAPVALRALHGTAAQRFTDSAFGISSACLILLVAGKNRRGEVSHLARLLNLRPLRYVGTISYSVYLWHSPVINWWQQHGLSQQSSIPELALDIAVVLTTTIVLSSLTYHFVELPALRHKKQSRKPTEAHVPALATR